MLWREFRSLRNATWHFAILCISIINHYIRPETYWKCLYYFRSTGKETSPPQTYGVASPADRLNRFPCTPRAIRLAPASIHSAMPLSVGDSVVLYLDHLQEEKLTKPTTTTLGRTYLAMERSDSWKICYLTDLRHYHEPDKPVCPRVAQYNSQRTNNAKTSLQLLNKSPAGSGGDTVEFTGHR